tara:strand:+ start:893 stop:1492 length:600 start_codon:yes stop_codon:yes gene_type:complete
MGNTPSFKITVGQYQELNNIDESLSLIEQNIYAAAAIKSITYEEASKIKLSEFKKIIVQIQEFNVKLLEKLKIRNKIFLNGTQYHLEHKPDKLTSGQLLDVINIRSNNQGDAVNAMHLLLAAMSRPKGKDYGDDNLTLDERAKLIKDVELQDVWNVFVFFWNLWNDYFNDSEDSLTKWMEDTLEMTKQILDNDGDSLAS